LQFAINTSKPLAPVALEGRLCLSAKPHEFKRSLVWLNFPPLAKLGIPRAGVATALNLHSPAVTGAPHQRLSIIIKKKIALNENSARSTSDLVTWPARPCTRCRLGWPLLRGALTIALHVSLQPAAVPSATVQRLVRARASLLLAPAKCPRAPAGQRPIFCHKTVKERRSQGKGGG